MTLVRLVIVLKGANLALAIGTIDSRVVFHQDARVFL